MLKISNLTTKSDSNLELDSINLDVLNGQVMFVVGPNGCGKSKLLKAIAGFVSPYEGSIKINHYNLATESEKAKTQLGYMPCPVVIEPYLTGSEYLELVGAAHSIAPSRRLELIKKYAEIFDISQFLYTPAEHLNHSHHQLIGLIASLIHDPKVVIWDEPLVFLDQESKETIKQLIISLKAKNCTIMIATNDLIFANEMADKVLVLDQGKFLAEGSIKQLSNQSGAGHPDLELIYPKFYHGRRSSVS